MTAFRSLKALALLAYLISENRAVTRDYLAGLAWPESSQKQALGLLRRSLHSLSSQLPGCLEIDRRTVRWRADAPASVDIYQFERLASSREDRDLAEGVSLYRAPYLEGVYLDGCPEFERWLVSEQQRWHQRVVQMLTSLISRPHPAGRIRAGPGLCQASVGAGTVARGCAPGDDDAPCAHRAH